MRNRSRLSYANVMATVAVVIALTGTAIVAYALEKNEVKSFHIDNGTIKTEDLDKQATIGNARRVNGSKIRQISWKSAASPTPPPTVWKRVFRSNGLTISAWCSDDDDEVVLRAQTSADNSILGIGALHEKGYDGSGDNALMFPGIANEFNSDEPQFAELDDTTTVMSYGNGADSKPVVTATFLANQWVGGTNECKVVGTVVSG